MSAATLGPDHGRTRTSFQRHDANIGLGGRGKREFPKRCHLNPGGQGAWGLVVPRLTFSLEAAPRPLALSQTVSCGSQHLAWTGRSWFGLILANLNAMQQPRYRSCSAPELPVPDQACIPIMIPTLGQLKMSLNTVLYVSMGAVRCGFRLPTLGLVVDLQLRLVRWFTWAERCSGELHVSDTHSLSLLSCT